MENIKENKQRLVCVIMGQNCKKFLPMCLESVKDADAIVFCDGGSTDGTLKHLWDNEFDFDKYSELHDNLKRDNFKENRILINNDYNQEDKGANGKQRNFYLNYLKENYPDDWVLCLDVDESIEDLSKIKEV